MLWIDGLVPLSAGLALLLIGAEGLVRGAAALALRMGLAPVVVGLTVVAFGTSSPELVVSIDAALSGNGGVAVGNVIGSNIANLGLIVGVAAVLSPMAVDRGLALRDTGVMIAASALLSAFLMNGTLGRIEGAVLVVGLGIYLSVSIRIARKEARNQRVAEEAFMSDVKTAPQETTRPVWQDALLVLGGLALLVIGSNLLVDGAVEIARRVGVGEAVIGLTLVALGTSLPELATTVVAGLRGRTELALGNAVGSNIFNVTGVIGPAALAAPLKSSGISAGSLAVMMALCVLSMIFLVTDRRITRWEGAALLVSYAAYIGWVSVG